MNFSKRNKYVSLMLLVILNIVFRIPTVPHEIGEDTFKIHAYANIISERGFANWVVHPLSLFGMYPLSYPSAVPFMLSGCSQSTGLNVEYIILVTAIIIGLTGMFTSYIMAKELKNDDLFALLVAFTFSLSPIFLSFTIWTASTRNLFMALVPLFVWGLLGYYNKPQSRLKYVLLIFILFMILSTTHRMVLLLAPILIAYCIALILNNLKKKENLHFSIPFKNYHFIERFKPYIPLLIFSGIYIFFIVLQMNRLYIYKDFNIWWKYQSGFFFMGRDPGTLFMNMVVDYASKIGILSVFMIVGLTIFLKKSEREFYKNFSLVVLLLFAPIITLGWYVPSVLLVFFCVLLVYGLLYLINFRKIQRFTTCLIIIFLLISTIFSIFMLWNWDIMTNSQKAGYIRGSTINAGTFTKEYGVPGSSFLPDSRHICAVAEMPYPLLDCAYIWDLINKSELKIERRNLSLSSLMSFDNPETLWEMNVRKDDYYTNPNRDIDRMGDYLSKFKIKYVITRYRPIKDPFYSSVFEKKPMIYDNNKLSVWYIE